VADLEPAVEYARTSDGVNIAHVASGSGPFFVVLPNPPVSHIGLDSGMPDAVNWFERLSARWRVVRYDCRGAGLSDRDIGDITFEDYCADLEAVLEKVGAERFVLFAQFNGGPLALHFASRHPERVSHLILHHTFSRYSDYLEMPQIRLINALAACDWQLYSRVVAHIAMDWRKGSRAREKAKLIESAVDPETFARVNDMLSTIDLTPSLATLRVPTLVLHHRDFDLIDVSMSRNLASRICDAKLVLLEGIGGLTRGHEAQSALDVINRFVHGDEGPVYRYDSHVYDDDLRDRLSAREIEVLNDLVTGLKSKEIATKLGISVHTVERHIANIYHKTGARSRAAAASYAVKRGMLGDVLERQPIARPIEARSWETEPHWLD
jgi:pimeloyl-ACP methyl ester carboxylesterase/DNA-binding CsgD family transcriptional regulator